MKEKQKKKNSRVLFSLNDDKKVLFEKNKNSLHNVSRCLLPLHTFLLMLNNFNFLLLTQRVYFVQNSFYSYLCLLFIVSYIHFCSFQLKNILRDEMLFIAMNDDDHDD